MIFRYKSSQMKFFIITAFITGLFGVQAIADEPQPQSASPIPGVSTSPSGEPLVSPSPSSTPTPGLSVSQSLYPELKIGSCFSFSDKKMQVKDSVGTPIGRVESYDFGDMTLVGTIFAKKKDNTGFFRFHFGLGMANNRKYETIPCPHDLPKDKKVKSK